MNSTQYYSISFTITTLISYLYLVLAFIGTMANILAFIVFSRKKFANTVFETYVRTLLIIDTIGLIYLAVGKFLYFEYLINLRDLNIVLCKLTMLIAYSIPPISAYLTVMISFDRWLSIAKPHVLIIRRKRKFQLNVCWIIILVNILYNGQLLFSYLDINPTNDFTFDYYANMIVCLIPNESLLSKMDLINSTILPFFLMILFSSLTINAVFVSRSKIRHAVMNATNGQQPTTFDISRQRDIKFAITSILLNIIFLLLNGPFSLSFFIFNNYLGRFGQVYFVKVILLLSYLNHGCVFFINFAVNTQFNEELLSLFLELKQKFRIN